MLPILAASSRRPWQSSSPDECVILVQQNNAAWQEHYLNAVGNRTPDLRVGLL